MTTLMMGRGIRAMWPGELLFWFVMPLGVVAGFALAYPMNVWLVAKGMKHGLTGSLTVAYARLLSKVATRPRHEEQRRYITMSMDVGVATSTAVTSSTSSATVTSTRAERRRLTVASPVPRRGSTKRQL
jgi:hypothetical protein